MPETKIDHFISLHQILIPNSIYDNTQNYLKNAETVEINYLNQILKIKYSYNPVKNEINLTIESYNIISLHIKRLFEIKKILTLKFDDNIITEYLLVLGELIEKYFNYCSICGTELEVKGLNILSCCKNSNCICASYQTVLDNKVTTCYKSDPIVFIFLLNILITGTTHPKGDLAYKPLPNIIGINNVEDMKNLLENEKNFLEEKKITNILDNCETDLDLLEKTNNNVYSILKNAISNNYFSMSSRDNVDVIKNVKKNTISTKNTTIETTINTSCIKFIHINYSAEIENKFKQKYFLFHGSNISSWYPIVKNGLKVMSGTNMMANGAAFGIGIYFSNQFNISLSYCSRSSNQIGVVGVFEVLEDPEKYKKTSTIFVINDEKIVLLRTLVLVNSKTTHVPNSLSNYFIKELPLLKQTNQINVGMLKNKRLEGEYKKLSNLDFIDEIKIIDQYKWIVNFKQIKNIKPSIEIIFSNYPLNPPIIKLFNDSNNNIKKINGLTDVKGNINIDIINPSNWKITNTLSEISTILYKCFKESF